MFSLTNNPQEKEEMEVRVIGFVVRLCRRQRVGAQRGIRFLKASIRHSLWVICRH